ncbi:DUF2243 domain-containing protein [Paracoccus fontiphilus]|uniref:DUF2243 domain-containing protein n=1 Tax=Paracoccus fontiphilus TaxID=1815556 RepID=A0ABV7IE32_9RHOB|nr:DUF2243 domain-containing protein [Paracoccus fontiphilus]
MADRSWIMAGATLGFALGGFFDGILLHQILQWHHLLSLVPAVTELRTQVMWDGYFHALMYGIAALGLWLLWRTGRGSPLPGRGLAGAALIGFGAWHVVDTLLSHWILGIHRIKVDSPNPLFWDLLWLVVFGLLPAALGLRLLRGTGGGLSRRGSRVAGLFLSLVTLGAGAIALRPPPDQPLTAAVFRQSLGQAGIDAVLKEAGAELVWTDGNGVVLIDLPQGRKWHLYRRGALLVSGAGLPPGCFSWSAA